MASPIARGYAITSASIAATLAPSSNALAAAGVEESILEWSALDDIAGLQLIAEQVLPHVQI